ncbi:MAG: hypothetical protein JWR84_4084 [Caulobacter sp.]|nr:hypothetical protein [Caulobacter sp.]
MIDLLAATLLLLAAPAAQPVCVPGSDQIFVVYPEGRTKGVPVAEDVERVVALIEASGAVSVDLQAKDSYNRGLFEVEEVLGARIKRPLGIVLISANRAPQYGPGEGPEPIVDVRLACP